MSRGDVEAGPDVRFAGAGEDRAIGEEDDETRGIRLSNDLAATALDSERRITAFNFGFASLPEGTDLSNEREGLKAEPAGREERSNFMGEGGARNAG